jgi:hypothetical protein
MSLPALDNLVRIGQLKPEPRNELEVKRAALRWHGYRSENRYTVFQCLVHTVGWPANRWRVLDIAHQKRNLAEYEGYLEVEESTIKELCTLVPSLIADVQALMEQ